VPGPATALAVTGHQSQHLAAAVLGDPGGDDHGAGDDLVVDPGLAVGRVEVDGLTARVTTSAFTYDYSGHDCSCSLVQGVQSNNFHLRKPVNGMWACSVPADWTYSATTSDLDCAVLPSVPTTKFRLVG
jgi:hypothetical protein